MSIEALRDDAAQMLRFVAADIESEQTRNEEISKATGRGPSLALGELSAAHEHGISRAVERFSLIELVSEYRALRASVTRMWIEAVPLTHDAVAQLVRFNEALDQILAEGVAKFSERMDRDADLFTASVGHDLANPVDAVTTSIHLLAASENLSANEQAAVRRITRAASRLSGMLTDLRDFTRTRLGGLVRIDREPCDVGSLVREMVDEIAAIYPGRQVIAECKADLVAHVDVRRISQLVSNLVANALQHGTETTRVTVSVYGDTDNVTIDVHNTGPPIEPERLRTLFEPLSRLPQYTDRSRLGLGLYIAQQIALAHNGAINVTSAAETGTRFTVRLPRHEA
jgi:signal transduction histidine kinase